MKIVSHDRRCDRAARLLRLFLRVIVLNRASFYPNDFHNRSSLQEYLQGMLLAGLAAS
jgi:hypothetical protein